MVAQDPEVAELTRRIEETLLPGPRKRITDDVLAWGEREARRLSGDRLLDAYNEAVEAGHREATEYLRGLAADPPRKPVLLRLLSDPRATDLDRILTTRALAGHLQAADLPEFGRVNVRQRPGVVPAVRELLKELDLPEARFLLRKVLPAVEGEKQSGYETGATGALSDAGEDTSALLLSALAFSEAGMAELRTSGNEVLGTLSRAAEARDQELVTIGRTASGLNDYESLLRRELHLLVLLADLPVSDRLKSRARDSLLGLDLDRFESRVAPALPPAEVVNYVSRTLSQDNRRRRPDRAAAALRTVVGIPEATRAETREAAVSALADPEPAVVFEAASALALSFELDRSERAALVAAAARLPEEFRLQLQPLLGAFESEIRLMPFPQAVDWARGASPDEVENRVVALLREWQERAAEISVSEAEAAMTAISRLLRVPPFPDSVSEALIEATSAWLRAQGGTAAATRALVAAGSFFADFAITAMPDYSTLNARAARRLLHESIRKGGTIRPISVAAAAGLSLDSSRYDAVVAPELQRALRDDPTALERAVNDVSDSGVVSLMVAALQVLGEFGRDLDAITSAAEAQTTEALRRTRDQVLEALEIAEQESERNADIRAQLGLIRSALGLDVGEESVSGPSAEVTAWRSETRERHPALAHLGESDAIIGEDADPADLVNVMLDLDPRVYGRGVVPKADRGHYAGDLGQLVHAYSLLPSETRPPLPRKASPKLRDAVERRLAANSEAAAAGLAQTLRNSDGAGEQARRLAIETRSLRSDTIAGVLSDVSPAVAREAAVAVSQALVGEHRKLERAREANSSNEARAAAEIARRLSVPFQAVEERLYSYFRLRAILEKAGWRRVAPQLGAEVPRSRIDPSRFSIREEGNGAETDRSRFLVRSMGIEISGQVVQPAVVEPVLSADVADEEEEE